MPLGDPGGNFADTGGYGGNFPGTGGATNRSGTSGGNPTNQSGGVGDFGMRQAAASRQRAANALGPSGAWGPNGAGGWSPAQLQANRQLGMMPTVGLGRPQAGLSAPGVGADYITPAAFKKLVAKKKAAAAKKLGVAVEDLPPDFELDIPFMGAPPPYGIGFRPSMILNPGDWPPDEPVPTTMKYTDERVPQYDPDSVSQGVYRAEENDPNWHGTSAAESMPGRFNYSTQGSSNFMGGGFDDMGNPIRGMGGYRQFGGPVEPGGQYTVGENGPETLQMNTTGGGQVIPNNPMDRIGGGFQHPGPRPGNPNPNPGMQLTPEQLQQLIAWKSLRPETPAPLPPTPEMLAWQGLRPDRPEGQMTPEQRMAFRGTMQDWMQDRPEQAPNPAMDAYRQAYMAWRNQRPEFMHPGGRPAGTRGRDFDKGGIGNTLQNPQFQPRIQKFARAMPEEHRKALMQLVQRGMRT